MIEPPKLKETVHWTPLDTHWTGNQYTLPEQNGILPPPPSPRKRKVGCEGIESRWISIHSIHPSLYNTLHLTPFLCETGRRGGGYVGA